MDLAQMMEDNEQNETRITRMLRERSKEDATHQGFGALEQGISRSVRRNQRRYQKNALEIAALASHGRRRELERTERRVGRDMWRSERKRSRR